MISFLSEYNNMDIGSFDTWFGFLGLALVCVLFAHLWLRSDEPRERKYVWTAMDISLLFVFLLFVIDARGWVDTTLFIGQFVSLVLFLMLVRRAEMDWTV
jgi:hypothetical protein